MARNQHFISFQGVRMTTRERDEILKMEYIRGDDIPTLAEKYKMAESTLMQIRRKGKWVKARKEYKAHAKEVTEKTVKQLYAGHKVEINMKYDLAWQKLMNVINLALDNPQSYMFHKDGNIRWGVVGLIADLLTKAQAGQNLANGVMPKEVEVNLEIQREKLNLVKGQLDNGELDGAQVVNDNLVETISNAANVVFKDFTQKSQKDIAKQYRKKANE